MIIAKITIYFDDQIKKWLRRDGDSWVKEEAVTVKIRRERRIIMMWDCHCQDHHTESDTLFKTNFFNTESDTMKKMEKFRNPEDSEPKCHTFVWDYHNHHGVRLSWSSWYEKIMIIMMISFMIVKSLLWLSWFYMVMIKVLKLHKTGPWFNIYSKKVAKHEWVIPLDE